MLKTVLLPLDGSPLAERALPYAAALARRSSGAIVLVEAVQGEAPPGRDQRLPEVATVARTHGSLGEVAHRLRTDGVKATVHVSHEHPVGAILDAAQLHRADVIVMSTHGRSGLGRMVYGSVADVILRHADVPVLLIPAMADHPWPTDRPLTVLVPLDGSQWGEAALGALDTLFPSGPSGLRVCLLRVVVPIYPLYGDGYNFVPFDEEAERAGALFYLDGVAARLADHGYTTVTEVAVGSSATTIATVARDRGVDLIAMATHGRSGLARAVLGSTATSTIQRADVPILLTWPTGVQTDLGAESKSLASDAEQVSPEDTSVMVLLTSGERDLVEAGLELLLAGTEREEHRAAPIRAILARIADAASDRPEALATAAG